MRSSRPKFFIISILVLRKALVEISLCFYKQNVMWTVVWTVVWTVCGLYVDCCGLLPQHGHFDCVV